MSGDITLQFDAVTYTLAALVVGLIIVPTVLAKDPDIHPYALLRQSSVAPIRNRKESAVYRSLYTPHGYPLVSGLGLPTKEKYSTRHGDIRDIWKQAIEKGKGKLLSVKGVDIEEHDISELTKNIHSIGSHFKAIGAQRVGLFLPNDIENLVVSFACAFYGVTLVLLPFDPAGTSDLISYIKKCSIDVLVVSAGQVPPAELEAVQLRELLLVVAPGSQHLDFSAPQGSRLVTAAYHEIIKSSGTPNDGYEVDLDSTAMIVIGPKVAGKNDIVEFSHRNIVAGVASQIAVLPKVEKYTPEDVFVPVDTLSDLYARIHTYVALSSGSTVALSSISGKHADIEKAVRNVNPTIIVVSPDSALKLYLKTRGFMMELWHGMIHWFQTRTLTRGGRIPQGNFWTRVNDYTRPEAGNRLRLIFIAEGGGDPESQALNSLDLSDLRVFFKAKVVYGLKHHKVAGPVTQCNIYDYRVQMPEQLPNRQKGIPRRCAHFGAPTPALEIKTKDINEFKSDDKEGPRGQIYVAGPVVAGGKEAALGFIGKWEPEGVLSYV